MRLIIVCLIEALLFSNQLFGSMECAPQSASEACPIVAERPIPSLEMVELTLQNGIKVCLKPTEFEEDEILINGFAPGGYSLLPPAKRASAQLSAAVAWESGIGSLSSQQLMQFLYEEDMELATCVGYCNHSIEGRAHSDNFPKLLEIIHNLFTAPHFNGEIIPKLVSRLKESARLRNGDIDERFEDAVAGISSGDNILLRPLTESEISSLDNEVAENFYRSQFLNPNDYTFVIVGDFETEKLKPLIAHWLGSIPSAPFNSKPIARPNISFPKGVTRRFLSSKDAVDHLTRITFCLALGSEPFDLRLLETATQVIETRLRHAFMKEVGSTQGIDVALELPLHPSHEPLWLTLQFRSEPQTTERLIMRALRELKELQDNDPTVVDIQIATSLQDSNNIFWEGDNQYWLMLLSNHYQLGLHLDRLFTQYLSKIDPHPNVIGSLLRRSLDLAHYTVVTVGPARD